MATEKRLIDAHALYQTVESNLYWGLDSDGAILDTIDEAPTVDAVEVVRCKECLWAREKDHREPTETPGEFICQCAKHHYIPAPWGARMAVKADDFCSYGEKK